MREEAVSKEESIPEDELQMLSVRRRSGAAILCEALHVCRRTNDHSMLAEERQSVAAQEEGHRHHRPPPPPRKKQRI